MIPPVTAQPASRTFVVLATFGKFGMGEPTDRAEITRVRR